MGEFEITFDKMISMSPTIHVTPLPYIPDDQPTPEERPYWAPKPEVKPDVIRVLPDKTVIISPDPNKPKKPSS